MTGCGAPRCAAADGVRQAPCAREGAAPPAATSVAAVHVRARARNFRVPVTCPAAAPAGCAAALSPCTFFSFKATAAARTCHFLGQQPTPQTSVRQRRPRPQVCGSLLSIPWKGGCTALVEVAGPLEWPTTVCTNGSGNGSQKDNPGTITKFLFSKRARPWLSSRRGRPQSEKILRTLRRSH